MFYLQYIKGKRGKKTGIGVIKGNSSFMFAAVSAVLNVMVDNAIQRAVFRGSGEISTLRRFYLPHHSVTPRRALQPFRCRTEKDPNSHLPGLRQEQCAHNKSDEHAQGNTPLLPFSGSGQRQDRVCLLASKWLCPL